MKTPWNPTEAADFPALRRSRRLRAADVAWRKWRPPPGGGKTGPFGGVCRVCPLVGGRITGKNMEKNRHVRGGVDYFYGRFSIAMLNYQGVVGFGGGWWDFVGFGHG